MNQQDFRALLASAAVTTASSITTATKPKSADHPKSKPKQTSNASIPAKQLLYRDRARERREGVNQDYLESDKILESLSKSIDPQGQAKQTVSVEESKFLGGDVEHTHLVKGLDFTLLNKVKAEMTEQQGRLEEEEEAKQYIEQVHGNDSEKVTFQSKMAETIYMAIMEPADTPRNNDLFLPGRMTYQWNLSMGGTELPITLIKSKAEIQDHERMVGSSSHHIVLDKVIHAIGVLKAETEAKKKLKKKEKEAAKNQVPVPPTKVKDEGSDDDIFAGVGSSYVADRKTDGQNPPQEASSLSKLKFKVFDDDNEQEQQQEAAQGLADFLEQDEQLRRDLQGTSLLRREAKKTLDPSMAPLPKMAQLSSADMEIDLDLSGSDNDEADYDQVDLGTNKNKKRQLTRFDFENEEDWIKYKDNQVHLPKAAFQFGQKAADGRLKNFDAARKKKGDQKSRLNAELQKIDQVMKQKYSKGVFEDKKMKRKEGGPDPSSSKRSRQ